MTWLAKHKLIVAAGAAALAFFLWRRRASAASAAAPWNPLEHPTLDPYGDPQDCSGRIGVVNEVTGEVEWKEIWTEGCD